VWVESGDDLTAEALAALLGEREVQSHAVLLSAASHASEWAAADAPDGAVVVAGHQIAARGRAGAPWNVVPGRGLGFALVLRPQLEAEREGFLYTIVLTALADVCGPDVAIEWPDEVHSSAGRVAATGIDIRLGREGVKTAVVNVMLPDAQAPRGALLRDVLRAIDERRGASADAVLEDHRRICATLGRHVYVQLLGGRSRLEGTAVETLADGALVIETTAGRRVPVRPQDISSIRGG